MRAKSTPIGFTTAHDKQRFYDEADLSRAVQAYRFFYPTVSGTAIFAATPKWESSTTVSRWISTSAPLRRPATKVTWIQTIPAKGWFAYFRAYGPEQAAFDDTWKPGDFEKIG